MEDRLPNRPEDEGPPPDEPPNPTSEELDVEGPNESAPGHEPSEGESAGADPPARSSGD
jgi:hypothetical protein